ncbi:MAG TPA: hypothetical protein VML75_16800 [Kofleriaceae bacterium]|nr:hypothetical protein [Kofleriaceae bacterium]
MLVLVRIAPAAGMMIFLLAGGCNKGQDAPAEVVGPPIEVPEIQRGKDACEAWRERACRCAATDPALAPTCEEAGKIPAAMKMSIQAANSEGLDDHTRARLVLEARRIMARCLEEQARIDPGSCPMTP